MKQIKKIQNINYIGPIINNYITKHVLMCDKEIQANIVDRHIFDFLELSQDDMKELKHFLLMLSNRAKRRILYICKNNSKR